MDRVESIAASSEAISATWNGIQDQAASLLQVSGSWRGRRPTLESDGTDVVVGAHDGFAAGTTQANAVFVPAAGRTAVTLGTLANDTWYAVYARNNAGAVAYSVEAYASAPPNSALTHKNSDRARIYIGCFLTSGSAVPRAFMMVGGRYVYRTDVILGQIVLNAGTAGAFADVDCSALLPAHALLVSFYGLTVGAAATDNARVRTNGAAGTGLPLYPGGLMFELECDASQLIEYEQNSATSLTLYVTGFSE